MDRLAEIRARCEAAVHGPWETRRVTEDDFFILDYRRRIAISERGRETADFIAHAREDVPWLLTQLEQVTAERDAMAREVVALGIESVNREKRLARIEAEVEHWAQAEAVGKLIELPCKIGDAVYWVSLFGGGMRESEVKEIKISMFGFDVNIADNGWREAERCYFSREAAEAALRREATHE